ncbi:MAG: GAK system CofD-like protein [Proteobacteria bacterium]|nr:GAK system CofD-like protein [Pseudomonadota bacterium]
MRITITREVDIPDRLKLERFRRTPELGPKVLFFSGGTALKDVSRELISYTHNSIHIITPFDSGGSSAVLRKAFDMPAVGDIRNRLMALADQTVKGNPEIYELFAHRLNKAGTSEELHAELVQMAEGRHPLVRAVSGPMRKIVRNHFLQFLEAMPPDFDLRGASIGNLVLTAGYLGNRRQMDPVIFIFSKLVEVCGVVRPVANKDLHLAVELEGGEVIIGQHRFTGKERGPISSRIRRIWLTASLDDPTPVEIKVRKKMSKLISEAGLICYPVGSFFSSVVANLLPQGVGQAVAANRCPKVFVPNTGRDPEAYGLSIADQARIIRETLTRFGDDAGQVLEYVLVDSRRGGYPGGLDKRRLAGMGIKVIDCPLVKPETGLFIDERLLVGALLSLA